MRLKKLSDSKRAPVAAVVLVAFLGEKQVATRTKQEIEAKEEKQAASPETFEKQEKIVT